MRQLEGEGEEQPEQEQLPEQPEGTGMHAGAEQEQQEELGTAEPEALEGSEAGPSSLDQVKVVPT